MAPMDFITSTPESHLNRFHRAMLRSLQLSSLSHGFYFQGYASSVRSALSQQTLALWHSISILSAMSLQAVSSDFRQDFLPLLCGAQPVRSCLHKHDGERWGQSLVRAGVGARRALSQAGVPAREQKASASKDVVQRRAILAKRTQKSSDGS